MWAKAKPATCQGRMFRILDQYIFGIVMQQLMCSELLLVENKLASNQMDCMSFQKSRKIDFSIILLIFSFNHLL